METRRIRILNLTLSADESVQLAGLEMLDSLKSRDQREQAFIGAATRWFLDTTGHETQMPNDDYSAGSPTRGPQ